ncbi:unnamed protein product [Cylicocyclus nassatus]|uniref:Chitin-binding type-2 domain-containing protein n=1 Tax=Cylicocyclus nassatus TaxID=53992 RepID=A0AA36HHE8_CYLNA|nr:unnamed protein product [Cylicocyclus nassatus]
MKCPPTLVFDERKGHCDYLENCSKNLVGHSESVLPTESGASKIPVQPAAVPTPTSESVESKSVLAHTKTHIIDVDCSGKKDGYYSSVCKLNFVLCSGGLGTSMSCPPSFVYNPQKGRCDYKKSCSVKVEAQPSPVAISPTVAKPLLTAPVPDASPAVSQQKMFDCKGKMDGFYSNGRFPSFFFCNEGKATPMKCPSSLVFNARKGHCDYVENCNTGSSPLPLTSTVQVSSSTRAGAAPANDALTSFSPPPAPSPIAPSGSPQVSCAGKNDGYYSNGCTSEFVLCSQGTATIMKCPAALVFDEKKGHCDYLENCADKVPPTVNCAGKKDGYYGCSVEFVFCSEGMATVMKCPDTLVFNERKGFCDYVENCGKEERKQPSMTTALPTVQQQSLKARSEYPSCDLC